MRLCDAMYDRDVAMFDVVDYYVTDIDCLIEV